jgi:hypothetical protein
MEIETSFRAFTPVKLFVSASATMTGRGANVSQEVMVAAIGEQLLATDKVRFSR